MQLYRFPFSAMSCDNDLQLYADNAPAAEEAARHIVAEVRRIERRYSRYREDSIVSEINRQAGLDELAVDEETAALLDYAAACHEQSGGLFDITSGVLRRVWNFSAGELPEPDKVRALLPLVGWNKVLWQRPQVFLPLPGMELDFGGIGKEYAVDRAATVCLEAGIGHAMINLGGDLCAVGPHPDGSPWLVGIRHPRRENAILATLPLYSGALASSGDYARFIDAGRRRYSHILDPRSGMPVEGLQAVTVHAPNCLVAGSVSTIAMLKGEKEGLLWLETVGLPWLAVSAAGEVHKRLS
ncbi:MAG: FAD:protein FMN transferase [Burkholderiales bacterium]